MLQCRKDDYLILLKIITSVLLASEVYFLALTKSQLDLSGLRRVSGEQFFEFNVEQHFVRQFGVFLRVVLSALVLSTPVVITILDQQK